MSQQLINRNPDLKRLQDDGYDIAIKAAHLVVYRVPYVTAKRVVRYGELASTLALAGDEVGRPSDHIALFTGEYPCDKNGNPIEQIRNGNPNTAICNDLVAKFSFSSKPTEGYPDYFDKMTTYINILSAHAQSIDPSVVTRPSPQIPTESDNSVFEYLDTASSKSGISEVSNKLADCRIAIIGLGGTGSYILDLISKTPVKEIHLFDGDSFMSHNAFRSPGAASLEELRATPQKVDFLLEKYSKMHKGITAHDCFLRDGNLDLLDKADFAFVCIDNGHAKKFIVSELERLDMPFIDAGMGIFLENGSLGGQIRTTTSTSQQRAHFKDRVSYANNHEDIYTQNIQIADLNALNAAFAVIKWKKLLGFYHDFDLEHSSVYTVDGNTITNEDKA